MRRRAQSGVVPDRGFDTLRWNMSYTVLARRYRSTTFDEVIGQDHVAQTLKKAIASGRIAHAYLFCGTRGVGKTSMARILAKALNCESTEDPTATPCGKCNSCVAIARGDDMDVIEIDAASNRGIDNIRDLINNAQFRPARSRFKIYIIDEVHGLSKDAFNALLKVLEEPPSHVKFILATTEPEKVLATILSRCQRYDFRNLSTREIADHLKEIALQEKIKADDDALLLVAKAGAGSMRDSLSLLDRMLSAGEKHLTLAMVEQLLGLPRGQLLFDLANAIGSGDLKSVLGQADALIRSGLSVDSLIGALVDHLRNLLIVRTCGVESDLVDVPGLTPDDLTNQAAQFDPGVLAQDIAILEELRRQIRQSQAGRALLDASLVRLSLADQFASIGDLLAQVGGRGGDGATPRPAPPARPPAPARPAPPAQKKNVEPLAAPTAAATPVEQFSADSVVASGDEQPLASDIQNVEPVVPESIPDLWRSLLAAMAPHGPGLMSLLAPGRLVGINEGRAVIRYSAQHETYVKLLDRNGKKDLVRDGFSRLLNRSVGVKFEVDADTVPSTVAPPPASPEDAAPAIVDDLPPAADAIPRPHPQVPGRVTPEMVAAIREETPLVKALMDGLGAMVIKVE